jgi:hypothetical protein
MGGLCRPIFAGLTAAICLYSYGYAEDLHLGALVELVDSEGQRIPRLEASGIVYYQGQFIVVDDTLNSLFVFDRGGRLSYSIDSDVFPRQRAKFEDLTFGPATGDFFVVGSHEGWDREVLARVSVLLRFRLNRRADGKLAVDEVSVEELPLYKSFDRLGLWKPGSMKIEGLAFDSTHEHLYVGLREPADRARVYRFDVDALVRLEPDGEPPLPQEVLSFDAGSVEGTPFCISALLWLPAHQGLLIATSTEDESEHQFLGNRLWLSVEGQPVQMVLDTFDRGMKAEGLAIGDGHLVIAYDNDQDDTDIPSKIRLVPIESVLEGHP